jgi:hypothetical protein
MAAGAGGTSGTVATFDAVYYNVLPTSCPTAPTGWTQKVEVIITSVVVSPETLVTLPALCENAGRTAELYTCVEVRTTEVVVNHLEGVIGLYSTQVHGDATAIDSAPPKLEA